MENPYQSPYDTPGSFRSEPTPLPPEVAQSGMVRQVPVVAVLMLVQGALECVMGLVLWGLVPYMRLMMQRGPRPRAAPDVDSVFWSILAVYGIMGTVLLVVAMLRIVAGWRNRKYQGRVLGIVSHAAGFLALLGCYCFPTALALGIYGLIVYLSPEVIRAFELSEPGAPQQAPGGSVQGY